MDRARARRALIRHPPGGAQTADAVRKVNNPLLTAVHAARKPEMTTMLSR
jgi:hypothetical protein